VKKFGDDDDDDDDNNNNNNNNNIKTGETREKKTAQFTTKLKLQVVFVVVN